MGDDMDKKKITNMEVKKKNRNEVFRYICKQGTVSNPDISYNTMNRIRYSTYHFCLIYAIYSSPIYCISCPITALNSCTISSYNSCRNCLVTG